MVLNQWVPSDLEKSWLNSPAVSVLSSSYTQCSFGVQDVLAYRLPLNPCSSLLIAKVWRWNPAAVVFCHPKITRHLGSTQALVKCSCQWGKGEKGKVAHVSLVAVHTGWSWVLMKWLCCIYIIQILLSIIPSKHHRCYCKQVSVQLLVPPPFLSFCSSTAGILEHLHFFITVICILV